jgi:hypothetical protein
LIDKCIINFGEKKELGKFEDRLRLRDNFRAVKVEVRGLEPVYECSTVDIVNKI